MYARLELIGNLTADPIVKEVVSNGQKRSVTEFSIAVNDPFKKDDPASFFNNLAAWNGIGESIAKFCVKGSKVFVVADVKMRSDEKDGVKRNHLNATVRDVRFLGGGPREDTTGRYDDAPPVETPAAAPVAAATPEATTEAAPAVEAESTEQQLVAPF